MSILDIVLIVILVGVVALALRRVIQNKKQGKSSCGCDCGSCACGCDRKSLDK